MSDNAISTVGDVGWFGYRSRPDPLTLPEGIAQRAENIRFVRGRAEVRKGIKRLLDGVSVGTEPVTLPFTFYGATGPVVRDSYTGGIFGSCIFSSPGSAETGNGDEYIALFGSDKCVLYRYGASTVTKTFPAGEIIEEGDILAFVQAFDDLFVFRARPITGTYARKSCTITRSGTTVTVTCTGHGFSTNNRVCIEGAAQTAYNIEADITRVDANTFTYTCLHSPTTPATGTITCRLVKPPLMWDGGSGNFIKYGGGSHAAGPTYSTLRSTGVCCYQNNQLFIAKTPIKDEVMVSDVLDPNTFDPLQLSFRANAGSNDYIVALHPFAEGQTLIFGRKSIYRARIVMDYATGTSFDPTSSFIELVTNEVGCCAANSIVSAGEFVFFLSDKGVYKLDTSFQDLKVRGVTLPLSDSISDAFDDITQSAANLASAVWFDSRYWLSVPTGGSTTPNTLLIWNSLTNEWESKDSFPAQINTLLVSDYADRRRLFASSRAGKLFLLEENEAGDDAADATTTTPVDIPAILTTRRHNAGDMQGKRWLRVIASVSMPAGSSINIGLNTYEYDKHLALTTLTNGGATTEEYVTKSSARVNAVSGEITFTNNGPGRPTIRTAQAEVSGSRPSLEGRTIQ